MGKIALSQQRRYRQQIWFLFMLRGSDACGATCDYVEAWRRLMSELFNTIVESASCLSLSHHLPLPVINLNIIAAHKDFKFTVVLYI